jgi:hypothetical protein
MSTTLIATLGQSPGAVTGLYLELSEYQQPKQPIDRVHLLGTQDNDVLSAARVVKERLTAHRKDIEVIEEHLDERDFRKVEAFQKIVTHRLQESAAQGNVIVGITGGRTGMGAMLAISAQFYGNVRVCHYWVDDKIAQNGPISQLGKLKRINPDLYELVLNPGSRENRSYIVELPAANMVERREYVERHRTTELAEKTSSQVFSANEANAILRLLPRRMTIDQAREYTEILQQIEGNKGIPNSYQFDRIIALLEEVGISNMRNRLGPLFRLAEKEPGRFHPEELQRFINDIIVQKSYWTKGLEQSSQANQDDAGMRFLRIGTSAAVVSAVGTFMQALILMAQHLNV